MRTRYSLPVRLMAYFLLLLAVAASFLLLVYVYIVKCPFTLPANGDISAEVSSSTGSKVFSDGKMLIETDLSAFNALAERYFRQQAAFAYPDNIETDGLYCVFKEISGTANELFVNLGYAGITFSFKCVFDYTFSSEAATVALYDIRLGNYELPYFGPFFWRLLGMPESFTAPLERRDMMYLSSISVGGDGKITLVYDYDASLLTAELNEVLKMSEERKIEFHSAKGDIDSELIALVKNSQVTPEEARELVIGFEKNPRSFRSLCYLLDESGIQKLYSLFGENYYKYINADKLAEASESELNSDLNAFSKKFSRLLLQYLYRNPDYEIYDGTLYVRGSVITPETVMGAEESVYDIEILADKNGISVKYGISGYEIVKKVVSVE